MPRGALSWARLMVSRGTVIWGGGSNPSVVGGHSCIYMHILAIYMHIWHIHAYTCIDLGREYIHAYMCIYCVTDRVSLHGEHHTCIYVQIHAYTCIYMHILCMFMYDHILITMQYSCIYLHIHAYTVSSNCTGSLNFCTYMRTYMHVFARIL